MNKRVKVISFGYGYGMPEHADLLYDVRFLRNPFYDVNLRYKNGTDSDVAAYVAEDERYECFVKLAGTTAVFVALNLINWGVELPVIAFGCTGGQHRSVAVAEAVSKYLREQGFDVSTVHTETEHWERR